jgi:phosphomevalonate kinase
MTQLIVCISGKRKSGKDYVANRLATRIRDELHKSVEICRISEPLKTEYAQIHGLDANRLLTSDAYKETYRLAMINWGDAIRQQDSDHFCRLSFAGCTAQVCIVSDCRRLSDIEYFSKQYATMLTVRVNASEHVRMKRGYVFTTGIDDAESECALDEYDQWNAIVKNDDDNDSDVWLLELMRIIELKLKQHCVDASRFDI